MKVIILLILCATMNIALCAESTKPKNDTNLLFTIIEHRAGSSKTITCVFSGNEFSASLVTDEVTKNSLSIELEILNQSKDSTATNLRYTINSITRTYNDSGQEEATSPTSQECQGKINLKSGVKYPVLHGGTVSYDIKIEPFVTKTTK